MSKSKASLTTLIKRQEQIAARIHALKAKEAIQQRKEDTRRKILAGAYILDKHQRNGSLEGFIAELNAFLFKPHDRALFGLLSRNDTIGQKEK